MEIKKLTKMEKDNKPKAEHIVRFIKNLNDEAKEQLLVQILNYPTQIKAIYGMVIEFEKFFKFPIGEVKKGLFGE